jgi:nicotinate phosphoribosyltransferase
MSGWEIPRFETFREHARLCWLCSSLDQIKDLAVQDKSTGENVELLPKVLEYRKLLNEDNPAYGTTNDGELAAFIAYAAAFPRSFLCLIDTYDTLRSGLLNFILVALVLDDCGYNSVGIRLDSGDLAYLSMECARAFADIARSRQRQSFLALTLYTISTRPYQRTNKSMLSRCMELVNSICQHNPQLRLS